MTRPIDARPIDFGPNHELEPGVSMLWQRFSEMASIPRQSRNEGGMIDYVRGFAEQRGFEHIRDGAGNVLITVPATPGLESSLGVVIQAHMDMVCVPDGAEGPAGKGVEPEVDESGEWVRAKGTTLGADNGIGLATALALVDDNVQHGPLKILATVDEETGLNGASNLNFEGVNTSGDMFLLNLDTEEDDELTIGCGGAGNTEIVIPADVEPIGNRRLVRVSVNNLMGGHSGVVIAEPRQNAIKVLETALGSSFLSLPNLDMRLVQIKGGDARNAIPRDSEAVVAIDPNSLSSFEDFIALMQQQVRDSVSLDEEKGVEISTSTDVHQSEYHSVLSGGSTMQTLNLIRELPHGVKRMSADVPGLPETSTNLGLVSMDDRGVVITMLTRSLIDDDRDTLRGEIRSIVERSGAQARNYGEYPGWKPEPESELVALVKGEYTALTGKEMKVGGIHAGLECGVLLGNPSFVHMQAVSIGPKIEGAHTVQERVSIRSVDQTYKLLRNIVTRIAA